MLLGFLRGDDLIPLSSYKFSLVDTSTLASIDQRFQANLVLTISIIHPRPGGVKYPTCLPHQKTLLILVNQKNLKHALRDGLMGMQSTDAAHKKRELGMFARWHTSDAVSTIRLLGKMQSGSKDHWAV